MDDRHPRVLVPGFWLHPCGLLLPSTVADVRLHDDVDGRPAFAASMGPDGAPLPDPEGRLGPGFKVYATEPELDLFETDLETLWDLVSSIPAEAGVVVVASIAKGLWPISGDGSAQLRLARRLFGPAQVVVKMGRFIARHEGGVLFSEQALARLQAMLLQCGASDSGRVLTDEEVLHLKRAVVAVPNHLVHATDEKSAPSTDWLPYLTQNYAFNAQDNLGSAMARNWRLFVELAKEIPQSELATSSPALEWLAEDVGLSLEQQLTLGFALYAKLGIVNDESEVLDVVVPRAAFDGACARLGFDEVQKAAALELISQPRSWFQEQFQHSERDPTHASWNILPFLQRPFLRAENGNLILTTPRAIETWLGDGAYYRLLDSARQRGQGALNAFTAWVGHLVERYAVEVMESVHPEPRLPDAGKVHREKSYGKELAMTSDLAISYPNALVLMEVSSPRLTTGVRLKGDPKRVRKELDRGVGSKPDRLGVVIEAIKPTDGSEPRATLDGVVAERLSTILPVIVTAAPLHGSPPMDDYFNERKPETFARPDVAELEVLDLEDFEALASIAERGTPVLEALERKQAHVGSDDLRRWLNDDPKAPAPGRPKYVEEALERFFRRAVGSLGFDGQDFEDRMDDLRDAA